MSRRGGKSTKAEAEAGARNLAKHNEAVAKGEVPPGPLTHGAYSHKVRQRYTDKRTTEGRQLHAVMSGLIADLGGNQEITSAQRLLLDSIKSKIIVLCQISKYVDRQVSIINSEGELLPCLGRNYTVYTESLRRDLEALFAIRKRPAAPSYEKALRAIQGGKA